MAEPALERLGGIVAEYRAKTGRSQQTVADATHVSRTVLAHFEQGIALPSPESIEDICRNLQIPRRVWYAATHPDFAKAMTFERLLAELLGKSLTLTELDEVSQRLAVVAISRLLSSGMSLKQAHAQFNAVLTFYGEKPVSDEFFRRFLTQNAFADTKAFRDRVESFQSVALRIYGSFRQAFKRLRDATDLDKELAPLEPVDETQFTQRREFVSIEPIPPERLDDLGYISAERVRRESRDRQDLSDKLIEIASQLRSNPKAGLAGVAPAMITKVKTLLHRMGSELELDDTLFGPVDPELLEREAKQVAPEDAHIARIEQTQEIGSRNLAAYLSEPYMDVYIATSMRERADFISVNRFVESLFLNQEVAHLHLRYFNPTLSWVSDRVAKGLVEALMLKRARLAVYMAQKTDTFGKDSEASVCLGQGKPVIVFVPKLSDERAAIDSEGLMSMTDTELGELRSSLELPVDDEATDRQVEVGRVLRRQLNQLGDEDLARVVRDHWADFDLFSEVREIPERLRDSVRRYLDEVAEESSSSPPPVPSSLRSALVDRLVNVALLYERRARTFREIHPLALQVILSSGVLNGILVVRSAESCARVMNRIVRNTLETELIVDEANYRLVEKTTRSTLRVISRHKMLTNAFWTQFFD